MSRNMRNFLKRQTKQYPSGTAGGFDGRCGRYGYRVTIVGSPDRYMGQRRNFK